MFYDLIQRKRNEWLSSENSLVVSVLSYIERRGMMRDAQIDAIKTYLFLKIGCNNKPLWQLFSEGDFLTLNLDEISLTVKARQVLETNKAAATLYEYACSKDDNGNTTAPALKQYIENYPDQINYVDVFKNIFYKVAYPDYIFSLPMGAGKTYLMAAFIYLDLYFSLNEPDNAAFAHNFMILAPSGLKASIIPSIRNIQNFDPTWVLPEPTASKIKNEIHFEILDEQKTDTKSNFVKNPNAQKINNYLTSRFVRGLVAVTNAEKVILDRYDTNKNPLLFSKTDKIKFEISNELRSIIGKIPHLSIFIDEVHHASSGDIKLRQVVNQWAETASFNSVLGFSGTPYLHSAEAVSISQALSLQNKNLSNVVYYYPLIKGVDNFLKHPVIKFSNAGCEDIVRKGISEFLETYGQLVYANGTCAKIAVYCGTIQNLEENVFPLVASVVSTYGLNPDDVILKYHGGNNDYPPSADSALQFASLDTKLSKIRVVLLVQIGKEGWDCKSLTGVILPQEGVCPQNMVLQTSCRCLRQVVKGKKEGENETALIWLNADNAKTLNKQLDQQQHTSIEELNSFSPEKQHILKRFSRMEKLHVPPIDFYQLKVSYQTLVLEDELNTTAELQSHHILSDTGSQLISQQDLEGRVLSKTSEQLQDEEQGLPVTFSSWLHIISKESFGTLGVEQLRQHTSALQQIFDTVTEQHDHIRCFKGEYSQKKVRAGVRKAFIPHRKIEVNEELIPETARLLRIEKLQPALRVDNDEAYYPAQEEVMTIVEADKNARRLTPQAQGAVKLLQGMGNQEQAVKAVLDDPANYEFIGNTTYNKTYHYLPYKFDSRFEIKYFSETLQVIMRDKQLEYYFNGDEELTEFKIRCYKQRGSSWGFIGSYTPDFIILQRDTKGEINKIMIVETKGEGFADKFADRKRFMSKFVELNNNCFGYQRFNFLYIDDTMTPDKQDTVTISAIKNFFE